ncbi:MAG: AcrVA2 family anti-CRISPR protein [Nitrospiria bacterium]
MDDRTIQSASDLLSNVNRLAAYSSWRVSKGIYRFDPDLYRELLITPFDGNLPSDVLTRILEYCLYVETPDMFINNTEIHGFYYRLDFNEDVNRYIASFLLDADPNPWPISIQLGSWTLAEGLERNTKDIIENASGPLTVDPNLTRKFVTLVKPFLNLILYICSENAEIGDGEKTPGFPKLVKTKKGTKMFVPGGPTVWDVGLRIGAALRRAREVERRENGDPQRSVRPHIRRAHWHKYWIGTKKLKDGVERRFVHNWIPPIPVKVEDYDKLPAVVKPVR